MVIHDYAFIASFSRSACEIEPPRDAFPDDVMMRLKRSSGWGCCRAFLEASGKSWIDKCIVVLFYPSLIDFYMFICCSLLEFCFVDIILVISVLWTLDDYRNMSFCLEWLDYYYDIMNNACNWFSLFWEINKINGKINWWFRFYWRDEICWHYGEMLVTRCMLAWCTHTFEIELINHID